MAMRDLVTGGAACAVPGATSSSSSNPLGALANALVGSSSKTQERLKEIPTTPVTSGTVYPNFGQQVGLPGSEHDQQQFLHPDAQGSEFYNQFRAVDHGFLNNAWDDIHHSQVRGTAHFQEFDNIYNERDCQKEKQCIRDRRGRMARHIFADKSEEFINAQVNALLSSLDIDNNMRMKGPIRGRFQELDEYWNESQGSLNRARPSDRWVSEFQQQRSVNDPDAWAHAFEHQHGANGWASEFEQEQYQMSLMNPMRAANAQNLAAMEQTRMLAETMSRNDDPKFQVYVQCLCFLCYDPQAGDNWKVINTISHRGIYNYSSLARDENDIYLHQVVDAYQEHTPAKLQEIPIDSIHVDLGFVVQMHHGGNEDENEDEGEGEYEDEYGGEGQYEDEYGGEGEYEDEGEGEYEGEYENKDDGEN
ncbi:hypothetical protein QQ045_001022 [Rhodiola kirilowii]